MRARPTRRTPLVFTSLLVALAILAPLPPAHAARPERTREELSSLPPAPGERGLESRLLAPCCNTQTLDAHESEPAQTLRLEIRGRLYAGEPVESVEASIVERYGEGVRAAPRHDPLRLVAAGVLVAVVLAGVGLLGLLRRWRRGGPAVAIAPAGTAAADAYDARLDAELSELE
jgi:cytochrome c-type biogenesis protein CcmH